MSWDTVKDTDIEIFNVLQNELNRQRNQIELIASENFTSRAVMMTQGSSLTNKYAEGYPGRRYYGGCEYVDIAENLAIARAKQLFNCAYANVQPHSGSQANQEVFLALLNPGDTILAMSLNSGGHLTHGASVNLSGKWFHSIAYDVNPQTHLIDMNQVETLAHQHKPKLIIAGGSAYPRTIDFAAFRTIANAVGAYFMVDMAHFSGLVAGEAFPSPLPHADVVTTTTHKTLRGPRGGMILSNNPDLGKKFNSAVFPGAQGGPLMHVIAAKAVAFLEALNPSFKAYARQIVSNAQTLSRRLIEKGFLITTQGTDCHLCLVDLRNHHITGAEACTLLEKVGITCNKNGIPFDPLPPSKTSGIRLGTPACTTRGMKEEHFVEIADIIHDTLKAHQDEVLTETVERDLRARSQKLCDDFPLYEGL